jgi:hypothetical protein
LISLNDVGEAPAKTCRMRARALSAWEAWRHADSTATDVEAALRIDIIKFVEGITGPPHEERVHRAALLRTEATERLLETLRLHRRPRGPGSSV